MREKNKNHNIDIKGIESLSGALIVYPIHYYKSGLIWRIPDKSITVKELREEKNNENLLILNEVLNDINIISSKSNKTLSGDTKSVEEIEEIYEDCHNSTKMVSIDVMIRLTKDAIMSKVTDFDEMEYIAERIIGVVI